MNFIDYVLNLTIVKIIILALKILSPIVFLGLLGLIFVALRGSPYIKWTLGMDMNEFFSQKAYGSGKMEKKWQGIAKRMENSNPPEWKLAIIEAESMVEEILTRMGFSGASFGDKLKKLSNDQLSTLDQLTEAHQIRNNIVHDPDYRLEIEIATRTIRAYEMTLRELEAI